MNWKDQKAYSEWRQKQIDPGNTAATSYGLAPFDVAEKWVTLMEARMAADPDEPFEKLAKETEREATKDSGITGFQFGCVAGIIANCWIEGEVFRRWHNLERQIGTEGEEANESGGVLNPALLNFVAKK